MSNTDVLGAMLRYHGTSTAKLATLAEELTDAELDAPIEGYDRSIRATFQHVTDTGWLWHALFETGALPDFADAPSGRLTTVPEIIDAFQADHDWLEQWHSNASEDELNGAIEVHFPWSPAPASLPRWRILTQVVLHGQQHRSEIALALTRFGKSPGEIDFLFES